MNIQIVSNARNREGGENYNNVFTMPPPEEIDADNRRKTIHILSISYPQTIENVHENQCGIRIKYNFSRSLYGNPSSVKYRTPMMYLPAGHYTLEKMLTYLNDLVNEYDMTFILQGGRVGVKFNPTPVMINQLSKNDDGSTWDTDFTVPAKLYLGPDLFDFEMTTALEYMLGLKDWVVHPDIVAYKVGHSLQDLKWLQFIIATIDNNSRTQHFTFYGKFLPDISNGINKMMIYCDEVEQSIVGDVKARLLVSIPIKVEDQGSSSLCTYTPAETPRNLIFKKINTFHVQVHNTTFTAINFSAGVLTIEAVIEEE
jgi:hypothetical protein